MILEECDRLTNDPSFKEQASYLLTGWLNDYEYFYEEFCKYTEVKIKKGNINVIGLDQQAYVNCYGALLSFFKNNKEVIESRIENEGEIDFTTSIPTFNSTKQSNGTSNEGSSRFKDIFDD